jgi:phosphoglycerate dehydrogenase-like enzyme
VHAMSELNALLPQADFVALTCPLMAETEKLIDADALGRLKQSAYLLNAARGRVVDEPALIDARSCYLGTRDERQEPFTKNA